MRAKQNNVTLVSSANRLISRRSLAKGVAGGAALLFAPAIIGRAQAATMVKLGHTQPLTGPSASYGIRARDGALVAINEIKAMGGFADQKGNKYTFDMTEDDLIPECSGIVGGAHLIEEVMEEDCKVLTY